ncbi:MAG: SDR family NAD(P)-dependent oxidoreductase [Thermoleophilia bacterium]
MELAGRHVLITGASRGLGEALAMEFAGEGCRLSLVARDRERLSHVAIRLDAVAVCYDLTDLAGLPALVSQIEQAAGPIDVLVNNAAVVDSGLLLECDPDDIQRTIALDLVAPILLTRLVLPGMISRGSGSIAMISSVGAILGAPGLSTYCACKAGLSRFLTALELELAHSPVELTLIEASNIVGGGTLDDCVSPSACDATRNYMRLAYHLGLATDTSLISAARVIVNAIRAGRARVRLPRRHAVLYGLAYLPNRLSSRLYQRFGQPR